MWTERDTRRSRKVTCELIDRAEEGVLSWERLARDLLGWLSESEVAKFARRNDLIQNEEDDEDDVDED